MLEGRSGRSSSVVAHSIIHSSIARRVERGKPSQAKTTATRDSRILETAR